MLEIVCAYIGVTLIMIGMTIYGAKDQNGNEVLRNIRLGELVQTIGIFLGVGPLLY